MKIEGHRKQVALFLIAVLLPVSLLVALTLRIVKQERELSLKRVADERQRVAAEIGRDLTSRLDGLAREEASAIADEPARLARHGPSGAGSLARSRPPAEVVDSVWCSRDHDRPRPSNVTILTQRRRALQRETTAAE